MSFTTSLRRVVPFRAQIYLVIRSLLCSVRSTPISHADDAPAVITLSQTYWRVFLRRPNKARLSGLFVRSTSAIVCSRNNVKFQLAKALLQQAGRVTLHPPARKVRTSAIFRTWIAWTLYITDVLLLSHHPLSLSITKSSPNSLKRWKRTRTWTVSTRTS